MSERVSITWIGRAPSPAILRQLLAYELEQINAPQVAWRLAMEVADEDYIALAKLNPEEER